MTQRWRTLTWGVVALGLLGCHSRLPALERQGEHGAVIERAESSRFRPRRKAARAYARSLVETGDVAKAMAVLLTDYRKGGEIDSLRALADLERERGWIGLAAHHYARLVELEPHALQGREGVCGLFIDRARAYLGADEGVAADLDVRRARAICPQSPPPSGLAKAARASASRLISTRSDLAACSDEDCMPQRDADRRAALAATLDEAQAQGPSALLARARESRAELTPQQLSAVLMADLRGELGAFVLPDDDVRRFVGGQSWSDVAPVVMSGSPLEAAYLQLRLSSVLDVPVGPKVRTAADPTERWVDRALEVEGARGWRVHLWRGDRATAELELSGRLRPKPKPDPAADAGADDETAAKSVATPEPTPSAEPDPAPGSEPERDDAPEHWSARVAVTEEVIEDLLTVARLRTASGKEDLGLALLRWQLAEAERAGLERAHVMLQREVARALGWGTPWQAMALAWDRRSQSAASMRSAAATAILLGEATCGGRCRGDDDLASTTRVMGQPWVDARRRELHDLALGNRTGTPSLGDCPTLAEQVAPDAVGPTPNAVRAARDSARSGVLDPELGTLIQSAIASDLRPWCAAQYTLPVAAAWGLELSPAELAESMAHVPRMPAAKEATVHVQLALLGAQPRRAQLLAIAAAAEAADPRRVWSEIGEFAAATGYRDVAMEAWRETILHTRALDDRDTQRALLLEVLRDFGRSWSARRPVGAEAIARHVELHLRRLPESMHWAERRWVLDALGRSGDLEGEHGPAILEAVGGGFADEATPKSPAPDGSTFHDASLAAAAGDGRLAAPGQLTVLFAEPSRFDRLRTELAQTARDWGVRRRMAVGMAVLGNAQTRAVGIGQLRAIAAAAGSGALDAVDGLLVEHPAALEPTQGGAVRGTSVVAQTGELVRILLLPLGEKAP